MRFWLVTLMDKRLSPLQLATKWPIFSAEVEVALCSQLQDEVEISLLIFGSNFFALLLPSHQQQEDLAAVHQLPQCIQVS